MTRKFDYHFLLSAKAVMSENGKIGSGISSRYIHRVFDSKTEHQISKDVIKSIKKEIEKYVDVLITSIVDEHNKQNASRRKARLSIRRTIDRNLYFNFMVDAYKPPFVLKNGKVGERVGTTILSQEVS